MEERRKRGEAATSHFFEAGSEGSAMTLGRFLSQWHASAAKINASGASRRFRAAPSCRQLSDTAESETSASIDNKDAAMPSCCVPGCRSRTPGQEPGVTFHTFPKDPERRRQWTEAVRPGQRDWEPAKWTCVCSKHFLPEHFDRMSLLVVRIRADAVPLQQEPLSQQPGDGTAVAATAQHGAQQALTQSHTSPASPLQQAPMDVAESQETLAGPSQQAPMDVTESQETLPGPSQQVCYDIPFCDSNC
ncbi:uncharacterized protein LOC144128097 isoform X2 [Amblyomma americanum]